MARSIASRILFPAVVFTAIVGSAWFIERGAAVGSVIGVTSIACILVVVVAERLVPYRPDWNRSRGDLGVDSVYLPMSVGVNALIEPAVVFVGVVIGSSISNAIGMGLWPSQWPLLGQLALACVIAELFDYWAHRAMHENAWLWRFHSIHHSALRLYWLNATRAHPGEHLLRGTVAMLPMAILGASESLFAMLGVVNVAVGLFQHANIDFRLGPLSWIFSVGELHRWHHSTVIDEANRNYGNNFIFWDAVFGTRFLPTDRHCPGALGIGGPPFPSRLTAQLMAPFRWARLGH